MIGTASLRLYPVTPSPPPVAKLLLDKRSQQIALRYNLLVFVLHFLSLLGFVRFQILHFNKTNAITWKRAFLNILKRFFDMKFNFLFILSGLQWSDVLLGTTIWLLNTASKKLFR